MTFEVLINKLFFNKNYTLGLVNDFESGKWRYDKFKNYIWDNIAETALSKSERDNLIDKPNSALVESAKKLRLTNNDKIGEGSELCEILLYGIMKEYYSALPVVPKIFYKQNANDNAKGADSVHIVIEDDGNSFSLWFGEAKFYKNINRAITNAIKSVNTFLRDDDQIKNRK